MNSAQDRPTALVTGGRRGIGKGICLELAEAGFDIAVNDIEHDAAMDATLCELANRGVKAVPIVGDIGDSTARGKLVDQAWCEFGSIDCLVNNAGISVKVRSDILDVTEASYDHLMNINLKAMFFLTQAIAARMLAQPQSAISRTVINISSANSVFASIDRAEYCISKAGISMVTKLFAVRLASAGIKVYEIRPGVIASAMTQVVRANYDERIADGLTPISRIGEPRDIGLAVRCLATGAFPFSTGDAFHVDGGLHIQRL